MEYTGLQDVVPAATDQTVCVRISRLWYHHGGTEAGPEKSIHMVLINGQMNHMYAVVPYRAVDPLIDILHEGNIYEIGGFLLVKPRPILRPVEARFTMVINASSVIHQRDSDVDDFPTWVYCLTSFADLPVPSETPERLVDVIGRITAISNIAVFAVLGRIQPLSRRDVDLADPSGDTLKIVLWGDAASRFHGNTLRSSGQTEPTIAIFVGATVRDYGRRGLSGGKACRWYVNENIPEISTLRASLPGRFIPILRSPMPPSIVLRQQVGSFPRKSLAELINFDLFENEDACFRCFVRIVGFAPSNRWFSAICKTCGTSARPNTSFPLDDLYVCNRPACTCEEAYLRYEIALVAMDGTEEAKFILRGDNGEQLIGMPVLQVIARNCSFWVNPLCAAAHMQYPSSEFAAVVSNKYMFVVSVREGSFYRPRPSFEVTAIKHVPSISSAQP